MGLKTVVNLIIICCLCLCKGVHAQDIIKKVTGEKLEVEIIATSKEDVTYKTKNASGNDTIITISKSECVSIQKAGDIPESVNAKVFTAEDSLNQFEMGEIDARMYYTNFKKPGTAVLVISLISPLAGLVPAIISSGTPVKDKNVSYPYSKDVKLDSYYKGYAYAAKKKKQNVVWRNWTIGLAANMLVAILVAVKYY